MSDYFVSLEFRMIEVFPPHYIVCRAKGNKEQPRASLSALLFYYTGLDELPACAAVIAAPYPMYVRVPSLKAVQRVKQEPENEYSGQNFNYLHENHYCRPL